MQMQTSRFKSWQENLITTEHIQAKHLSINQPAEIIINSASFMFSIKIHQVAMLLLFASMPIAIHAASQECIFDKNAFSEKWVEHHPRIKNYAWDAEAKNIKVIVGASEILTISGGGCVHYGETYKLEIYETAASERTNLWFQNKFLQIADLVFDDYDLSKFKSQIKSIDFSVANSRPSTPEPQIQVSAIPYEGLGITVHNKLDVVILSIDWYMN